MGRMSPFRPAVLPEMTADEAAAIGKSFGVKPAEILDIFRDQKQNEQVFLNDIYQVNLRKIETSIGDMIWLSIKRIDKKPVHSWRDFQEIKNRLVGPEHEGVELYPAESRRVDTANQYHLYVFADSCREFPFGMIGRAVFDGSGKLDPDTNTRQEPL
jgi:hypothetical protein